MKSIDETIQALEDNNIEITQGPVSFGQQFGVSVFIRDPDKYHRAKEAEWKAAKISQISPLMSPTDTGPPHLLVSNLPVFDLKKEESRAQDWP